ncbi:MAG: hypothetical protein HQL80_13140 [Magnetococcales bacterium]|nr:hypothetical protein [Magnetococcales bacterium]
MLKRTFSVLIGCLLLIAGTQVLPALELGSAVDTPVTSNRGPGPTIKGLYLGMSIKEAEHLAKYQFNLDLRNSEEGDYYFVRQGSSLLGSSSTLRSRSVPSDLIVKTDQNRLVVEIILSGAFVKRVFQVEKGTSIEAFAQRFADEHYIKSWQQHTQGWGNLWYEYDNPNKFNLKLEDSFRILLVNRSGKSQ